MTILDIKVLTFNIIISAILGSSESMLKFRSLISKLVFLRPSISRITRSISVCMDSESLSGMSKLLATLLDSGKSQLESQAEALSFSQAQARSEGLTGTVTGNLTRRAQAAGQQ